MLGFVIGTVCLLGLIGVLKAGRRRRWARFGYGGCGGGHGDYGCGHGFRGGWEGDESGWHGERGGPFGRWFFLRSIFSRLETTPSQEKVIKDAIAELRSTAERVRGDVKAARPEVANAIRAESFDETLFGEISHKVDEAAATMRRAAVDAFAKVHAVLDERQKKTLAELVENGPRFGWRRGGWGGPYRNGASL
jgi:hypothetical protein